MVLTLGENLSVDSEKLIEYRKKNPHEVKKIKLQFKSDRRFNYPIKEIWKTRNWKKFKKKAEILLIIAYYN